MGERTFLTANCSFVTSFPNLPGDVPNDSGIFKIPASDSAAVIGLLNVLKVNALDVIKIGDETTESKNARFEKNQKTVYKLFEKSIDNILNNSDENTVVGMQEINNTEQVHNTLIEKLKEKEKEKFFVCSNVHDEIGKTYPTLGYILPGTVDEYLPLKDEAQSKIFRNGRKQYNYDTVKQDDLEKAKSHSLCSDRLNTIMAIRDLGGAKESYLRYFEGQYLKNNSAEYANYIILKKATAKDGPFTDSGRPISMVIKNAPREIYINCHMLNASLLKIFKKTTTGYIPQKFDNVTLSDADNADDATSLLQIGDAPISELSQNTGTDLWLQYCMKRLQATITELLNDFKDVKIDANTKVFIMGDFNDPEGKLLDKLEEDGINIKGVRFKFKFGNETDGKKVKSCCPNKNSAAKKGTETTIENVKQEKPFIEELPNLITDKKLRDEAIEISNYDPMFAGDNVGEGYIEGQPRPNVKAGPIAEKTSDHSFVKTTHELLKDGFADVAEYDGKVVTYSSKQVPKPKKNSENPSGGKRRTRRRRRRSTRRNKRRMSGRRRLTRRKR